MEVVVVVVVVVELEETEILPVVVDVVIEVV